MPQEPTARGGPSGSAAEAVAGRASPAAVRPPSVDALARSLQHTGLPHPMLVSVARKAVADALAAGDPASAPDRAHGEALVAARRFLRPVVNATGVLLHTNMGRAPLAVEQAAGYSNLELDLHTGRRGSRSDHVAALLATACGAPAALVVNNGAAAVLLVLAALALGREVVVSRGELVEIGGGFRIPEVLASSGARLVEVGTTNRTRVADYRGAVGADTALLLKVHTSNYTISGFTESVDVPALAALGHPVVVDLGSGLLDTRCPWLPGGPPPWLAGEPGVVQTLSAGASLVTFSGDKLLGGPQAGVVAGDAALVAACARHPLARALRPGGLVLAALQDVALAYLRRDAGVTLPLWRMATSPDTVLHRRAVDVAGGGPGVPVACRSVTGGGTLPGVTIASWGVALAGDVGEALRRADPPVIARVEEGRTICDLRSVLPEQDAHVTAALNAAAGGP